MNVRIETRILKRFDTVGVKYGRCNWPTDVSPLAMTHSGAGVNRSD
jgi:hypothetical protein